MKLMLITDQPEIARYAIDHGVDRIFVDLEIHGKFERQGHKDTLISRHSIEDVSRVRKAMPRGELLVRVNPLYEGSEDEIRRSVDQGADLLMLPMFSTVAEAARFCTLVGGRAKTILLVETPAAANAIGAIAAIPAVDELYIGLNDLHLALGLRFMFEPLASGLVDALVRQVHEAGKPVGFGGVARVDEGLMPGRMILGEHVRLGSSSVILSRTFHRGARTLAELRSQMNLEAEVRAIREVLAEFAKCGELELNRNHDEVRRIVSAIVKEGRS